MNEAYTGLHVQIFVIFFFFFFQDQKLKKKKYMLLLDYQVFILH